MSCVDAKGSLNGGGPRPRVPRSGANEGTSIPSLLGRDILSLGRLTVDEITGEVSLELYDDEALGENAGRGDVQVRYVDPVSGVVLG